MKKWIAFVVVVVLAVFAYAAAGPHLTVRAIGDAVRAQDAAALARQVDFPALRSSFKAQLSDRIARETGIDAQSNPLAALGLAIVNGLASGAVDAMITPTALGALIEGRKVWDRASGVPMRDSDAARAKPRPKPFANASYRYESVSCFTATVIDEQGRPIVFVLTRHGLNWTLSDIRLPM